MQYDISILFIGCAKMAKVVRARRILCCTELQASLSCCKGISIRQKAEYQGQNSLRREGSRAQWRYENGSGCMRSPVELASGVYARNLLGVERKRLVSLSIPLAQGA